MEVVCPEMADESESFTTHLVRPPAGVQPVPAVLDPGDVLFFNGSVVHGSKPNRSKEHWRRSFICHYMPWSAREVSRFYAPLFTFDGQIVERDDAQGGGPCGEEFKLTFETAQG